MTAASRLARGAEAAIPVLAEIGAAGWSIALATREDVHIVVGGQASARVKVTEATPFHVCSCSKTFTASVFSSLVQGGTTSWEQPIHDILPELQFDDPWVTRNCTFRDLACMRTGLSREGIAEWGIDQNLSKETRLARVRHMRCSASFRDRFSYSNLGYIALSLAAERLAGKPYTELVQELICKPLAMSDTYSAGFGTAPGAEAAAPALPQSAGSAFVRDLTGPNSEGSARIYLSCRDAARWLRFLLHAMAGSDAGPLLASSVRAMATPRAIIQDSDIRMAPEGDLFCAYGMGLIVSRLGNQTLLRHSGAGRGWRHAMAFIPESGVGVFVMASAESPAIDGIALHVLEGMMYREPGDWPATFTRAAESAAMIERAAIESAFPAQPSSTQNAPPTGDFQNSVTGTVRIATNGTALRFIPEDAPDFSATLEPLGDQTYALRFDEVALTQQPLDPPFRLRVTTHADSPCLETSHFGTLVAMP